MYKLFLKGTTSMSEDTFGFNELTDAAQDNALETFAKYYVRQYKQDNHIIVNQRFLW